MSQVTDAAPAAAPDKAAQPTQAYRLYVLFILIVVFHGRLHVRVRVRLGARVLGGP